MALEEAYLPQVTPESSIAQVDQTERLAQNEGASFKEESGKAANEEAKVYGEIGLSLIGGDGVKIASSMLDIAEDSDPAASGLSRLPKNKTEGIMGDALSTFEDMITGGARRKPGSYNSPAKSQINGEDLMARANITEMSLKDQGSEAIGSWAVKDAKLSNVSRTKQLTFAKELAYKDALDSVNAVRPQHSAMISRAQQMSPGLSMGAGPTIRPNELVREAEGHRQEEDWIRRMKEQAGT